MTMPINLDGEKPDNVSQEQWDRLKNVFDDIYADESEEQIMPDKLTDNDIVKALECCQNKNGYDCDDCPYQEIKHFDKEKGFEIMPNGMTYDTLSCDIWLQKDTLDLINRLQAENERLSQFGGILLRNGSELFKEIQTAKAEAYKECIEKAKEELYDWVGADNCVTYSRIKQVLDNLLKEMEGEK